MYLDVTCHHRNIKAKTFLGSNDVGATQSDLEDRDPTPLLSACKLECTKKGGTGTWNVETVLT